MIPTLIHPSIVKIRQVDRSESAWDDAWHRPKGGKSFLPEVRIRGQVQLGSQARRRPTQAGDRPEGDGYILLYQRDVFALQPALANGDVVTEIDGSAVAYDIIDIADKVVYGRPFWTKITVLKRTDEVG